MRGMEDDLLLGIDGGGTTTRVLAVSGGGRFLGYGEAGGCSIETESLDEAAGGLRAALCGALLPAGRRIGEVTCTVAGIAGINRPDDLPRARYVTARAGLTGDCLCVNDSVVAHAAAFLGEPGVVAIAGTGSIVRGVTDDGREIRNFDFGHWAAGAWLLGRSAVLRAAAGEARDGDRRLVGELLRALGLQDLDGLRDALRGGGLARPASLAPVVTAAAWSGAPLARAACDQVADELARGVRLVGACFGRTPVSVALVGSVATSPYVAAAVRRALAWPEGAFAVAPAPYPPVVGAAVMALQRRGVSAAVGLAAVLAAQVAAHRRTPAEG